MKLQFDLPLTSPVTQAILPIMSELGQVFGFVFITKTTFTMPIQEVMTSAGNIRPRVVTTPDRSSDWLRTKQYLAIVYTQAEAALRPWGGFPDFVSSDASGWYGQFHMTTTEVVHHFSKGALIDALTTGFSVDSVAPSTPAPEPTDEVTWTATVNRTVFDSVTYFDFNWVELFAQHRPLLTPTKIRVTGNPALGVFRASVVPGAVVSVFQFDTIRVILTSPPQPGLYTFSFSATTEVGEVPCVLNLSVT